MWEFYTPLFFSRAPKELRSAALLMRRRKPDGSWEYRLPTVEDEADWFASSAW